MATIWEDDFESGNALSVSYGFINNAETNATCGVGGGWGCRGTGTDLQRYFGRFRYTPPTPIESEYLRVKIDLDHAYANYDETPGWLFALNDSVWGEFLSLYHGADTGDDKTILWVQSGFELADGPFSATGAIELGTWQQITLEVWFSTYAATSPWAPNADGRVRVSVDGTTVIDSDTLLIQSWHTSADGTPNVTDSVTFGPMGNGDNIGIYTGGGWVDIANFNEVELDSTLFTNRTPSVRMDLWTGSPTATIQARLYDGTAETSAGESTVVTGSTPTTVEFDVTLGTGVHAYRLQVISDTNGVDLFCAGPGLFERPADEVVPPAPDPPPSNPRPSWWTDYNPLLGLPQSCDCYHIYEGGGGLQYYTWFGVSALQDGTEGAINYNGDAHGAVWELYHNGAESPDPIGARILWRGVEGATGYRAYMFNCTNAATGELFDPHLQNTNLVVGYAGQPPHDPDGHDQTVCMGATVKVRFKDFSATPNWDGWPETRPGHEDPEFHCTFTSETDGTEWTRWE